MKKWICNLLVLALCLSLIAPTAAAAGQTTCVSQVSSSETYLRTSHNEDDYLEFSISGSTLTVRGKILADNLTGVMLKYGNYKTTADASIGKLFTMRASLTHSGRQVVRLYTSQGNSSTYWSYDNNQIYIEKTDSGYRFLPSLVQENNTAFERTYIDPAAVLSSADVPASVAALSNEIVGSETDPYTKVFLLHQWVAENIYYDYDAYYSGSYLSSSYSTDSAGVLEARRSVCEGYSHLLKDLILAQGIPAMRCTNDSLHGSYALGTAGSEPHAHTEAYVDGRWITMDATWDSRNEYRNGTYTAEAPNGYFYFDITSEAFALDHKITARGNQYYVIDENDFGIQPEDGTLVKYEGEGDAIVLPKGVTSIAAFAFQDCTNITSVVIPEGVTSIGYEAFRGCTNLVSIVIPDSVTTIEEGAFINCSSLRSVILPAGLTAISRNLFNSCSGLEHVTIPDGVTAIGENAFMCCASLDGVVIPDSVTGIGSNAFYECTSLSGITVPKNVALNNWNQHIFARCTNLTSVTFAQGVTAIGAGMFGDCTSLTNVVIPDSVTEIGWFAFSGCTSLASITIPSSVTAISSEAFRNCTSLTSILIPKGVTTIDSQAFRNCTSLKSIALPASLTTVGKNTFDGCTALKNVCYGGTSTQWSAITMATGNTKLRSATRCYNCDGFARTTTDGVTLSTWATPTVTEAINAGLVPATLPSNYKNEITRAQFCHLAVALYEQLTGGEITGRAGFTDTNDPAVEKMAYLGVVNGFPNGTFCPDDLITRQQAANLLKKLAEKLGVSMTVVEPPYTDKCSNWAAEAVAKCYSVGIMNGINATTFDPTGNYTIQQSIVTMVRVRNLVQ